MPFAPGTRFGSYEVVALIGVGGMGEVYRAVDTNLKRSVAIKVLPPLFAADAEWLVRFQREAETLAALNHQNIAHVYGLERIDGTAGLVMELVDGPTLADRIVQGKVPLAEALSIAAQIADALEVAHERGIVHRDLKPANVQVRADGAVKVLDFGIAKSLLTAPGASGSHPTKVANTPTMTQLGMILGTAAYMSPEQARGKPVDRRTDVWAFGCVLYEMLVGKAAFEGEDAAATIGRVLEREVDMSALPPGVPAAVRQTLAACLQKDAKKRVRDLGDVKLALEGAFETRETAAAPRAGARPAWRRVGVPAAAFAAGAAAFALAAWRVAPPPEPPTVTRLSMPVASGSVVPQVSIARDGKRIAFWPGDSPAIRVRELDAFEWRTVAGAVPAEGNNGNAGCFSPDGAWLAFATGNALRRIALAGGAPLTVARDLAGADWCDWGDDGNLYFGSSAGIMRVPASGGAAEVVAAPSAEGGESYGLPQLLPGGKQLLFNVFRTADVQTARVDVLNLATRERKTLLDGVGTASYVPSRGGGARGYLLYGLGRSLFATPVDLDRLEVGAPRPVADDVISFDAIASATVSRSGTLAYLSGQGVGGLLGDGTLIEMNRDGTVRVLPEPPRIYGSLGLAPGGERAVISIANVLTTVQAAVRADVWVYDFIGERLNRVTFGGFNAGIWTPDGRRLIYFHGDTLNLEGPVQILSVSADNSGPATTLVDGGTWRRGAVGPASLSPDGKALLIVNDALAASDILVLELDAGPAAGAEPRPFLATAFNETDAQFSPDGRFVAYTSDESGASEVYVVPFPGPGRKSPVSRGGGAWPRWNPNGRELFYVAAGKLMAVDVETSPEFRAQTPHALLDVPPLVSGRGFPYDVSPDGQRFLMLRAGTGQGAQPAELRVVVNWIDELERGAPSAPR